MEAEEDRRERAGSGRACGAPALIGAPCLEFHRGGTLGPRHARWEIGWDHEW